MHVGVAQISANRPSEDRHCQRQVAPGLLGVGVLDGHGGWQVADWLSKALLAAVERRLEAPEEPVEPGPDGEAPPKEVTALEAAFGDCEAALLRQVEAAVSSSSLHRAVRVGACALCVLAGPQHLFVANSGDCQALLLRDGRGFRISSVHNADQLEEQRRLRNAHPGEPDVFVCKGGPAGLAGLQGLAQRAFGLQPELGLTACYVKGCLQPTRSFGDFYLKDARFCTLAPLQPPLTPPYITAMPEVVVVPRQRGDEAVVLASDGLWDFLDGAHVARVAHEVLPRAEEAAGPAAAAKALAQALVDEAVLEAAKAHGVSEENLRKVPLGPRRRYHDDITVVVVLL